MLALETDWFEATIAATQEYVEHDPRLVSIAFRALSRSFCIDWFESNRDEPLDATVPTVLAFFLKGMDR